MNQRTMTIFAVSALALMLAGCGSGGGHKPAGDGGGSQGMLPKKPVNKGADKKVVLNWENGQWWVQLDGGSNQKPDKATTVLKKDEGPTMFEVTIKGKSSTFPKSGSLHVWEDSKTSNPEGSTQILGPIISENDKKLTFFDLNQGPKMQIYYSITLADGTKIDPIVDNGGGGNMEP